MFQSYNHSRLYTVVNVFSSCFESVIVWGWLGDRFAAPISMIVIILEISIMSSLDLSVKQWYNNISQDYNKTAPSTEHNKCISLYIYVCVCVYVCVWLWWKLFHAHCRVDGFELVHLFPWSSPGQTIGQINETPVIRNAIALIITSLSCQITVAWRSRHLSMDRVSSVWYDRFSAVSATPMNKPLMV